MADVAADDPREALRGQSKLVLGAGPALQRFDVLGVYTGRLCLSTEDRKPRCSRRASNTRPAFASGDAPRRLRPTRLAPSLARPRRLRGSLAPADPPRRARVAAST